MLPQFNLYTQHPPILPNIHITFVEAGLVDEILHALLAHWLDTFVALGAFVGASATVQANQTEGGG